MGKKRTTARPTLGAATETGGAVSLAGHVRPSHLVVFREVAQRNASVISRVTGGKEAGRRTRAACTVLRTPRATTADARIYERLAVAVADLTPDSVAKLQADDAVLLVADNQIRSMSPVQIDLAAGAPAGGDALSTYLQGVRDGVDAALRFHKGARKGAPAIAPMPAADAAAHSWCLDMIGVTPGYAAATGRGVTVAVLDTGVDLRHRDFRARLQENDNAVSFVHGASVQDGNGHGTHCLGVVGGPAQSAGGRRYGVAPEASLLVGKVLNDAGQGYDDQILDGIDWADEMGARVISMSFGSPRGVGQPFADPYEVIASRLLNAERGVLLICAAGNGSARPFLTAPVENPAACPSIAAVAALRRDGAVADFSCRRMDSIGEVNLAAPGSGVYSAWTGDTFLTISGTSMATPHVAGAAALWMEAAPELSARAVWDRLEATAQPLASAPDTGRGLVRAP
ncbi:MAG: S8 family serine peptidase [Planctomycetales bacterium]|nr:S8 family serine peptidase [Planctomycetales bacterium]